MAFIEHSAEIYDTTLEKFRNFFVNTFEMIPDDEDTDLLWCDNTKTIGIKGKITSNTLYIDICTNSGEAYYSLTTNLAATATRNIFWQISKDGDVKYIRSSNTAMTQSALRLLFAKSDNGDWCIFTDTYMYHKNGQLAIGEQGVTAYVNTPFSACRMPNLAAGGSFPNLYKMQTATLFEIAGIYVNFGGEAYRVVTVQNTNPKASYAFPAADETA